MIISWLISSTWVELAHVVVAGCVTKSRSQAKLTRAPLLRPILSRCGCKVLPPTISSLHCESTIVIALTEGWILTSGRGQKWVTSSRWSLLQSSLRRIRIALVCPSWFYVIRGRCLGKGVFRRLSKVIDEQLARHLSFIKSLTEFLHFRFLIVVCCIGAFLDSTVTRWLLVRDTSSLHCHIVIVHLLVALEFFGACFRLSCLDRSDRHLRSFVPRVLSV